MSNKAKNEPEEQSDDTDIICPYCGNRTQAESCDNDPYEQETDCDECGKTFVQWANISIDYHTAPKKGVV